MRPCWPDVAGSRSSATLARLIEALGGGVIEVITAPRGLDVPVAEPIVFDRLDGPPVARDDLLLAVGIAPDTAEGVDVVGRAGTLGAAAVVVKLIEAPPTRLVEAAEVACVALLAVPPATGWGQLFTLLRTALGASGASPPSPDGVGLRIGDLFGLANAVAAMVGGATTIEDPRSNVLAFSSLEQPIDKPRQDTILGRRVPDSWARALEDRGVFKRLHGSNDVVRVDDLGVTGFDLSPRLAIAVRAGGEVLGSIWVVEGEQPLSDTAAAALRGAAQIAALHMLHHRASADLERQRRSELLRSLLDGARPIGGVTSLGLAPGTPLTVLAFAPELDDELDAELSVERVVALITLYAEVYRRRADAVAVGRVVYVLLPTADNVGAARLLTLANDLIERTEVTVKTRLRAGIGSTVRELRDVHRSRSEADQVLRVLGRRGGRVRGRVAHIDDLRGHVALLHLDDLVAQEPLLRAGKVERLVAHDARRNTHHIATLRAFLDAFGDIPAAAAALNIHRNTFRYRLGRLLEVSGIDLDDPDERLITHLQLRFLQQGAAAR